MDYPATIDQIWLFGSKARKDARHNSDTDVLVVSDDDDIEYIYTQLHADFGDNLDIAHYTYKGINKVVSTSSLFALHLKTEGIPVLERSSRLRRMLDNMPIYKSYIEDLEILGQLLEDTTSSTDLGSNSLIFEYGILGTATRNTGIILTHYLGHPDFSVNAPVTLGKLEQSLKLPISEDEYKLMHACRKYGERGFEVDTSLLSTQNLLQFQGLLSQWHHKCVKFIESDLK